MVRAKFYISEMTVRAYNPEHVTVVLAPVTRGEENRDWAAATPAGNITLTINNPGAGDQFREWMAAKQEIAITFEPAPPAS